MEEINIDPDREPGNASVNFTITVVDEVSSINDTVTSDSVDLSVVEDVVPTMNDTVNFDSFDYYGDQEDTDNQLTDSDEEYSIELFKPSVEKDIIPVESVLMDKGTYFHVRESSDSSAVEIHLTSISSTEDMNELNAVAVTESCVQAEDFEYNNGDKEHVVEFILEEGIEDVFTVESAKLSSKSSTDSDSEISVSNNAIHEYFTEHKSNIIVENQGYIEVDRFLVNEVDIENKAIEIEVNECNPTCLLDEVKQVFPKCMETKHSENINEEKVLYPDIVVYNIANDDPSPAIGKQEMYTVPESHEDSTDFTDNMPIIHDVTESESNFEEHPSTPRRVLSSDEGYCSPTHVKFSETVIEFEKPGELAPHISTNGMIMFYFSTSFNQWYDCFIFQHISTNGMIMFYI